MEISNTANFSQRRFRITINNLRGNRVFIKDIKKRNSNLTCTIRSFRVQQSYRTRACKRQAIFCFGRYAKVERKNIVQSNFFRVQDNIIDYTNARIYITSIKIEYDYRICNEFSLKRVKFVINEILTDNRCIRINFISKLQLLYTSDKIK